MYITCHRSDFHDAFRSAGHTDQFSYEARNMLFDYLEENEDPDNQKELDVIALCCDWYESDVEGLVRSYNIYVDGLDDDEVREAVEDYLNEHTTCIGETHLGHFLYAAF